MENEDLLKIWFSTDIHGSNACFRKFLKLLDVQKPMMKPNIMIIGGDITGKELVPIRREKTYGGCRYEYIDRDGNTKKISEKNLDEELEFLRDGGRYPIICDKTEYQRLEFNPTLKDKKLDEERKKRVEEWMDLLNEKVKNHPDVQIFINCGNDDPLFVDHLLGAFLPEGKVITIKDNVKLLSLGYSNLTPWECPRDVDEQVIRQKIAEMTEQISIDDILIFNFHCPPFNTDLDEVYEIDQNYQRRGYKKHVGSSSIREAIEQFKPILSLHGHIHEAKFSERIGSTKCVNPGSNYQNGILQGAYFIISDGKIVREILVNDLFPEKAIRTPSKWACILARLLSFITKL